MVKELPPLWAHQKECIELSKKENDIALFMGMGLGKSRTTVEILRDKYNTNKKILKTLIIAPTSVVPNWKREIAKYSAIPLEKVHLLQGSLKKRADDYLNKDGVFVTNFESFAFPVFSEVILRNPPNIIVADESQKLKDKSARRTKTLIKISFEMEKLPVKHRYILSGTPVLNSEQDLYTQFLFLNVGKTFGTSFFKFRNKYFEDKNAKMNRQKYFPDYRIRPGATEAIKELIKPISMTARKEDCLSLPPFVRVELDVELSSEQKRMYEDMKKNFISFCESGTAVANLAITKALRLQQILSGFLKLDDGTIHTIKDNHRAKVLAELLEDLVPNEKTVIWSIFQHDYAVIEKIVKDLGFGYAMVTGLVKDKQAELDRFRDDPNCRVMIASQAAGGVGVEMTSASASVYYSKGYSLEHDLQSESRNFRGGSEIHQKITRYDLVARNTVDEIVLTALRNKKDLASNIIALKEMLQNG